MSAKILMFPAVARRQIRSRPSSVAELPVGAKALVIARQPSGFSVSMQPAVTAAERKFVRTFASVEAARSFARDTAISNHQLFQLILDEVLERRQTLDEILGPISPQWDGAA